MKATATFLVALLAVIRAEKSSSTTTNDMSGKIVHTLNAIPVAHQKQEVYPTYQPFLQQPVQPQYIPVQLLQKPVYVHPQAPPAAMIILAQPAIVPQQLLYGGGGGVQHLINYFQPNNPQVRYQLLNGYQPQPTAQTLLPQQHPATAATIGNYQFVAPPQQQNAIIATPIINHHHQQQVQQQQQQQQQQQLQQSQHNNAYQHHPQQQQQQQQYQHPATQVVQQPLQLNALSNLAHLHAQQYTSQQFAPQFSAPIRSIPPIITGLENFTPEQQAAIKAQLNSHLGASGAGATLNALSANTIAPTTQPGTVLSTPQSAIHTTPQGRQQHATQGQGATALGQISAKYSSQVQQASNEYLPEKDESKGQTDSSTVYTPSMSYRGQFTKG